MTLNPLGWLADYLLLRALGWRPGHMVKLTHRAGFIRGYACGLVSVAFVYGGLRLLGVA